MKTQSIRNAFLVLVIALAASCTPSTHDHEEVYDVRTPFYGEFEVLENGKYDTVQYYMAVFAGHADNELLLAGDGLYMSGLTVSAFVTGQRIVIPIQRYLVNAHPKIEYEFNGIGSVNNGIIKMSYTVRTIQNDFVTSEDFCNSYAYPVESFQD